MLDSALKDSVTAASLSFGSAFPTRPFLVVPLSYMVIGRPAAALAHGVET